MSAGNYQQWLKEQNYPTFAHGDSFVFLGSCFSDELGQIIRSNGFESLVNPGGTIFHPLAIAKIIHWCFDESISFRILQQEDIFFAWKLSGTVFGMSPDELNKKMEKLRMELKSFLRKATHLFVTFGSAWAYRLRSDGEIVANCHKQAAHLFTKELLSLQEMQSLWQHVIKKIKDLDLLF
jgi:hypothetical protein